MSVCWVRVTGYIIHVCTVLSVLQDIVVSLVLAVVVNISGILGAYMAGEWTKAIPADVRPEDIDSVTAVRNSLIALAVSLTILNTVFPLTLLTPQSLPTSGKGHQRWK